MGCWHSRIEREETVSRCKARKRYMKQFVEARQAFSAAHAMYIRSLVTTGSALLHFANEETTLHYHHHLPPPEPQSPPPPPPPVSYSSPWDFFWDPLVPPSSTEEELAMVVSRNQKDLVEVVRELNEYFLKTADAGAHVSFLLEVPTFGFCSHSKRSKVYGYRWSLSPKLSWLGKLGDKVHVPAAVTNFGALGGVSGGHSSTVERLYTLEKKLCQEVKNVETLKMEHEKKVAKLRKLEMKRADSVKTEKTKKEVEKLESHMIVAYPAIETTSAEIAKLRETELYPQLVEFVKGLMCMWRSMYECHQVQNHTVQQLEYLNTIPSTNPTSEIHKQSTLQLELEVQQWHQSFCNLFKAHRDYIQSLTGWLRLSLFQFSPEKPINKTSEEAKIYSLCEEWNLAVDHIPDKAQSEGIKSLLTLLHAIVVQQREEHKQKKKLDAALKELEKKKVIQLGRVECKYGPYSMLESNDATWTKDPVTENLRAKAEDKKSKHGKSIRVTRAMTVNNLQMGLPQVFHGIVGFSSVCMEAFESVYNKAKISAEEHNVKRILLP